MPPRSRGTKIKRPRLSHKRDAVEAELDSDHKEETKWVISLVLS